MKGKFLVALPMLAILMAGCATTATNGEADTAGAVPEPVTVEVEPIGSEPVAVLPAPPQVPVELNSVEFITQDLVDRLIVTNTHYERTPSQAFKVTCTLRNMTGEPLRLQARTQYFAEDRKHEEGPGAWQVVFVPANGIETYTSHSYGTNLSYYYVEIQEL